MLYLSQHMLFYLCYLLILLCCLFYNILHIIFPTHRVFYTFIMLVFAKKINFVLGCWQGKQSPQANT